MTPQRLRSVLGRLGPVAVLTAMVLATYGPTLHAGFVAWDDPHYVLGNRHVQAHRPQLWLEILDPRVLVAGDWTPVVTATHIVERHGLGTDPAIYHATNIALQLACAFAGLALLTTLGLPRWLALGAATWYAVHPLQVESVAWVAARKGLLSTLFFLLAACAYLRARTAFGSLSAFGLFVLSVLSKATAVVLPVWLAGIHLIRRDRPRSRWALALAPFFAVGLLRGLYSVATQAEAVHDTTALGLGGRLAVMGPVLARYARQAIWPSDLGLLYPWPELGGADPRVLGSWFGVLALVAAVGMWSRRERRALSLGLLVPVALFPTLNLLPAPFLQADRYVHLALLGAAGLLALALGRLLSGRSTLAGVLLLGWALALVPVSRARTGAWLDSEKLWSKGLRQDSSFAPGHSNLGLYLLKEGRQEEAIRHFRRALELEPEQPVWRVNLAGALAQDGQLREARALLEAALAENPELADAHGTLTAIALREGRPEEALSHAERAVSLRPGDPGLEVHVPEALAALGRREEAVNHYERIARSYPIPQVILGWAEQERNAGHLEKAEALYRRLLEDWPNHPEAGYNLATMRLDAGDTKEALRLYDTLLAAYPKHAAAHNNRGNALVATGRLEEAERAYARAVELAPDDTRFKTNWANVLGATGGCTQALALYNEVLEIDPQSGIARLQRARCLLDLGRPSEATASLRMLQAEGAYPEQVRRLLLESGAGPEAER